MKTTIAAAPIPSSTFGHCLPHVRPSRPLAVAKDWFPHGLAWARHLSLALALGLALLSAGCTHVGPRTIPRDRADYSGSISESWKRQTLINIVRLRYLDPPIFVDVGQIVAGYTLESSLSAGATLPENPAFGGNTATLGGAMKWTDRPTVTYTPMTGDKFVKALMTPITPESVFFTVESGWPADALLFITVARLNGLKNQEMSVKGLTTADPRFLRALELLRQLQLSGSVGMRIKQNSQKAQSTIVTIRSKDVTEQAFDQARELRQLLGLSPEATELNLVFGAASANDRELAMQTRSLLHIMGLLAAQVEVPVEHVAEGRATPGVFEAEKLGGPALRMVRILSSKSKPAAAYVTVPYRGHWFWVDDRDIKSKRTFAFMMMLFTLADTGEKQALPLITIPAQ